MSEPATEDFLPLVPPSDEQRNEQRIELIKKLKENRIKNMKMQDCKTYDEKISYYESEIKKLNKECGNAGGKRRSRKRNQKKSKKNNKKRNPHKSRRHSR